MPSPTTATRVYPADNGWILKHRMYGSSAEVIHKVIQFYEDTKNLIDKGGLE